MKMLLIVTIVGLLLSACSGIPLKTMYKLATADRMNLNPAVLRAAVRMPESIRPGLNSAKLSLSMTRPGEKPKPETFILQAVSSPTEMLPLNNQQRKGYKIWVFRMNPKDVPQLVQLRERAKALKAETNGKAKGTFSIGVNVKESCRLGELASGKVLFTNWLKIDSESGYLATAVDYDARGFFKDKSMDEMIPVCE